MFLFSTEVKVSKERMAEIQRQIEADRKKLEEKKDMEEEEKRKVEEDLQKKEEELRKAQYVSKVFILSHHAILIVALVFRPQRSRDGLMDSCRCRYVCVVVIVIVVVDPPFLDAVFQS